MSMFDGIDEDLARLRFWLTAILVALPIVIGRFTIPSREVFTWAGSYEALAHIGIGYLIGVAVYDVDNRKAVLCVLGALTIFEVVMSMAWPK